MAQVLAWYDAVWGDGMNFEGSPHLRMISGDLGYFRNSGTESSTLGVCGRQGGKFGIGGGS